ncbi:Homocysteine S-methyltransferase [Dunaliella salina]|uniref:Homocysteine S-methyltransferase n=1 Tax=Dunaliella salina TaxID=3046 RepID=A0ABQ7GWE2_DUNSA|nr:Homocysteine S-methyltransferase [Dunaliella salina]|eukprot:KAF5838938.1 Homocysteine S-methyltransferase [Dunaliella salina]
MRRFQPASAYDFEWAGTLLRLLAPRILPALLVYVLPHLTTYIVLAVVAAKLLGNKKPQQEGASREEGTPEGTPSAENPTRSQASPQACTATSRTSQPKLQNSSLSSQQGLPQAGRASQAKRSEVQNVLERVLMKRIALMGGSISQEIKRFGLQEADYRGERYRDHPQDLMGNDDVLSLTCPDVVKQIYCEYLDAGVDILATNTYHSTWAGQSDFGLQDDAEVAIMNVESVRLAKRCATAYMQQNPGSIKLVAGALGPPKKTCTVCPKEDAAGRFKYNDLVDAYFKQVCAQGVTVVKLLQTLRHTRFEVSS